MQQTVPMYLKLMRLYNNNTYEWCKEGVTPQIDNLKGIPFESMPNWIHLFLQGENILIEELEDIKAEMPQEYGL